MSSKYFNSYPIVHIGYPMPDNNFGYLEGTYDSSKGCKICGIGKVQKESFRIARKPNLEKKSMFQLNWVFGEYFIRKDLWQSIFEPLKIGFIPVIHHKSGSTIDDIVQIKVDCVAKVVSNSEELKKETCAKCLSVKYNMQTTLPQLHNSIDAPIFKSEEWWGSGAECLRQNVG
jgi:hypothetical protein